MNNLLYLLILNDYFCIHENTSIEHDLSFNNGSSQRPTTMKQRLLLIYGNFQPNPGPEVKTTLDFNSQSGLKIIHLNVHSLMPKINLINTWGHSTAVAIAVGGWGCYFL